MLSEQSLREAVPGKGSSLETVCPGCGAYSRPAVLAVWTGPLSTPSPSQQYNGPVATGSSLHCVSSPGPPQVKWTPAAWSTRRRGKGERAVIKSKKSTLFLCVLPLQRATPACSYSTVKMALLLPHSAEPQPTQPSSLPPAAHSTPPLIHPINS